MRRNRIFVIFVVCHHARHLGTLHARTSTLRCAEFQSSQPPGVGAAEPDPQKVSFCSVLCFSYTRSVLLGCLVCSCSVCKVSVVVCYKVCQVCSCSVRAQYARCPDQGRPVSRVTPGLTLMLPLFPLVFSPREILLDHSEKYLWRRKCSG